MGYRYKEIRYYRTCPICHKQEDFIIKSYGDGWCRDCYKKHNNIAWYNIPRSWDNFANEIPWVWTIDNRTYPQSMIIMLPLQIVRFVCFLIYRLAAFLARVVKNRGAIKVYPIDSASNSKEVNRNGGEIKEITFKQFLFFLVSVVIVATIYIWQFNAHGGFGLALFNSIIVAILFVLVYTFVPKEKWKDKNDGSS